MVETVSGPIVLAILDGWGIAPESESNPIAQTTLPTFDRLFAEGASTSLWAHGEYVGLLKDQDGNSEAGHLNLGAGRIVMQDPVIISDAVRKGTFFKNPAFAEAIQHVRRNNSNLHLLGMLSDGQSAHSTPQHLYALLKLCNSEKVPRVFLHLFTDGRDSSPTSGKGAVEEVLKHLHVGQRIATIMGRFYAMDRKKEWGRTEQAYNAFILGEGIGIKDPLDIFDAYYSAGISDEFILPHVVLENGEPIGKINDNDSVIFFNHRSDRARQLTKPFVQKDFSELNPGSFSPLKSPENLRFVAMTDFGPDLGDIITAYPSEDIVHTLPMVLSEKRQMYIAESEKYAHMTYFFNGGYADPVGGEDRVLVPSPDVRNYEETPGMSTEQIINAAIVGIAKKSYDFVAFNIASLDMIGHTGNLKAAQKALRIVDGALLKIMNEVKKKSGVLIVTADHGNIEEMKNLSTGEVNTEHSKNRVPFIIWSSGRHFPSLRQQGILGDVAPTILELYGMHQPKQMTGKSLFNHEHYG